MTTNEQKSILYWGLVGAMGIAGAAFLALSYVVLVHPALTSPSVSKVKSIELPPYDLSSWHSLLVQQDGRPKPFESAAIEIMRSITGRAKFQGKDPVAIVLMWMMLNGGDPSTDFVYWEEYPFILCEYQTLREVIYVDRLFDQYDKDRNGYLTRTMCKGRIKDHFAELDVDDNAKLTREELQRGRDLVVDELTDEQRRGKYISPSHLRSSLTVKALLRDMDGQGTQEEDDEDLAKKAGEVMHRLGLFDQVSQSQESAMRRRMSRQSGDLIKIVGLDKVKDSPLFGIRDLQKCMDEYNPGTKDSEAWWEILEERVRETPQFYITPEQRKALEVFQEQIKSGDAQEVVDKLEEDLRQRREAFAAKHLDKVGHFNQLHRAIGELVRAREERDRIIRRIDDLRDFKGPEKERMEKIAAELKAIMSDRDRKVIQDLRRRVANAEKGKYDPEDPKFRMLHLGYLECRFPTLYADLITWQGFPIKDVKTVLASWESLKKAYRTNDADKFETASKDFMATVQTVSTKYGPYPGTLNRKFEIGSLLSVSVDYGLDELIDYELTLNHLEPFQKAWIIMLFSLVLFIAAMAFPAGGRTARICYYLAFIPYLTALGFQIYGFYLRIIIAGRPPVTNLYETVVWVSFMSAVFALILELIYRKKVIGLAGSIVATIGLVMADQLSVTFNPRISPLLPVLRTNYWLIIHVLTIVSSYAGGTLAWGVGNISLAILAFGDSRREVVKTLAQFTYRAMQIAVLLLAFGTFLGGMWAADSWGRFWGWDPKEVWALIALVCYIIPLHARYLGWVKDFGLAIAAVVCYAAIVTSWYLFNALGGKGLHAYAMSGGGPWWVFWGAVLNLGWVLVASFLYLKRTGTFDTVASEKLIREEQPVEV
jgi:ABC-type transport system involved in cytochrome c biogenesis permease subunit